MASFAELMDNYDAGSAKSKQPAMTPVKPVSGPQSFGDLMGQYERGEIATEEPAAPKESNVLESAKRFIGARVGEMMGIAQPNKAIREQYIPSVAAAADIPLSIPSFVSGEAQYWARRAAGDMPQEAQAASQETAGITAQPLGRLLGIEKTETYTGGTLPQLMNFIGENMSKGADWLAEKTGMAKPDVEHAMNTLSMFLPAGAKAVPEVGQIIKPYEAGRAEAAAWRAAEPPAPETMRVIGGPEVPVQPQAQAGAPVSLLPEQAGGPLSAGAAQTTFGHKNLTGAEFGKNSEEFPQYKLLRVGEGVQLPEAQTNAAIVNEVLQGKTEGIRPGVVTRDENALREEYMTANMKGPDGQPTPAALRMRNQIAGEQTALSDYAQQRVLNTGADVNLPNDLARGQRLNDAIYGQEGLKNELTRQKKAIYDEAAATVGQNPVQTTNLRRLMNDEDFINELEIDETQNILNGLQKFADRHESKGIKGQPAGSIASLEEIRKILNSRRNEKNKYSIDQLKNALDEDVAQAGGPELYQRAREVHRAEKVLFEPKGMQTIFGKISENDIKAGTPTEDIMKKLNSLSYDEWKHVYDTFDSIGRGVMPGDLRGLEVTPELQDYARSAANEMKGSIAREIYNEGASNVGEWSSLKAKKAMNNLKYKIFHAFDPSEIEAFHNLNVAGQLMPASSPYKGAFIQQMEGQAASPLAQAQKAGVQAVSGFLTSKAGGLPVGSVLVERPFEKMSARKAQRALTQQDIDLQNRLQAYKPKSNMTPAEIAAMGRK